MDKEQSFLNASNILKALIPECLFFCGGTSDWAGRTSACFGMFEIENRIEATFIGRPLLVGETIENEKQAKYFRLCREKANRLASFPTHCSSWQSRDPENGMWGGAVKVNGVIYSLSGFPELGDEAIMLILAEIHQVGMTQGVIAGSRVLDECEKIANISKNYYWRRFRGFLSRF